MCGKACTTNRSARGKRECLNKEMNRIGEITPKVFANASSSGKSKGRSTLLDKGRNQRSSNGKEESSSSPS